jgi:hypothetical protein
MTAPKPEPWNGHEPVIDALRRHGLADVFYGAMNAMDRPEALRLLRAAGVDDSKSHSVIKIAMQSDESNEN